MSSRHPHALVRTSPDTPGRSRRDLPYTSFGHGKLQLLQQLELRLQRHSRHITAIIGRLRTHLQALEQLRRDAALPAADRRRVVRCQSQSQQLMQSIRMLDAAAAGAHSLRRDYAHNMDRDIRSVPESDVLELDNLVAEGEQLVLRLMANSPLHDYMPFIFDRAIVSAQRHAVAWTAEAADPAMPAADPMQPAGATPTRAPARAPRTAAAAHPRSGLSWMYGRVLALEAHVVQYGAVLTAQLRALTAARDHAEVRGGDLQESTSRILETWQAQAQQGSLLPGLRSLAEEMAEAVGRHERGELALGSGLVRQLERRAIALVFNVGQHVLASPLDATSTFWPGWRRAACLAMRWPRGADLLARAPQGRTPRAASDATWAVAAIRRRNRWRAISGVRSRSPAIRTCVKWVLVPARVSVSRLSCRNAPPATTATPWSPQPFLPACLPAWAWAVRWVQRWPMACAPMTSFARATA